MAEATEPDPAPELGRTWNCRLAEEADLAFVRSSWRRNYDYAPCPGGVEEYIATQSQVIDTCLRTSTTLVAHPVERREQILGWVCFRRPSVVHYVYVKPYYRRHGIARELLLQTGSTALGNTVYTTHRWQRPHADGIGAIVTWWKRAGGVLEFNPALIFGGKT